MITSSTNPERPVTLVAEVVYVNPRGQLLAETDVRGDEDPFQRERKDKEKVEVH